MQNIDSIVRLDQPEILDGRDLVKQVLLNRLNFLNEGYAFIKKLEDGEWLKTGYSKTKHLFGN